MTRLEKVTQNRKQFRHKIKMHLSIYAILILATIGAIISGKVHSRELDLQLRTERVYAVAPTITPFVEQSPEQDQIVSYIKEVFGKDADNALKVAQCESGLNPRAVNDNTTWGGVSQDLGVFQINQHYQGVTNSDFLFNFKINTLMAKQIFDKWGHNFHAWTCGKKLGL